MNIVNSLCIIHAVIIKNYALLGVPDIEDALLSFGLKEPEDVLFSSCLSKPQFLSQDSL